MLDRSIIYGAILSSVQAGGRRYISEHAQDMDGIMIWAKFLGDFGRQDNLSHRIQELESELYLPWDKFPGDMVGYLHNIVRICNEIDQEDPEFLYHSPKSKRIKTGLVKSALSSSAYCRVSYEYFDQMNRDNNFDLNQYVKRIVDYIRHSPITPEHVPVREVQARLVKRNRPTLSIHETANTHADTSQIEGRGRRSPRKGYKPGIASLFLSKGEHEFLAAQCVDDLT